VTWYDQDDDDALPHAPSHSHSLGAGRSPHHRGLLFVLAPLLLLVAIGVAALWPDSSRVANKFVVDLGGELVNGTVTSTNLGHCAATAPGSDIGCRVANVRITSGPDRGTSFSLEIQDSPTSVTLHRGDRIVLNRVTAPDVPDDLRYSFADYQRGTPVILLGLLFFVAVVLLGRFQGVRALAGLALSLAVLLKFVVPSILDGNDAVLVSLVGAAVVMLLALYLAHGVNERTTIAVLGTFASLALTAGLALAFVSATKITGLADEDARILTIASQRIDVRGLLLGGIIIGALGVLDDVTVTQVSAVWELHKANPLQGSRRIYASALRIGRDHIASTVNTLVLAYAGASLPLLVLFVQAERPLAGVLTGETVATEVVRALVGSIGLIASVPITTAIAAWVIARPPADDDAGWAVTNPQG
jgi:uncharacterized membrane protein